MSYVHEDPNFGDLLRIVATKLGIAVGLVEKDYWVTHSLWALHRQGLEIWFKGGTSLSKGFGLIRRFSEDLDLKVEPGGLVGLPTVTNWKSEGKRAIAQRQDFFEKLATIIDVPGATVSLDRTHEDPTWRSANLQVTYPGNHLGDLAGVLRPFVLLEVGNARVTPFVVRPISSFVHDEILATGELASFIDIDRTDADGRRSGVHAGERSASGSPAHCTCCDRADVLGGAD